ncbi:MAG: molybdopterin-dependent oxidoreductase [Alphaproteobacteria bacterium]|nr:molybdopterin-dependent oxidoreductase [Alphaproteobacteria bacterium]
MSELNVVGKSVNRPEAYEKVTGGRSYPVNVRLPGMLHGKLLRSPYAHARILSIDTSRAEQLPGVKAVLVPADVPQIRFTPVYFVPSQAPSMVRDFDIMNGEVVRYMGQPVAAVAATTPEIAEAALLLIDVRYEELPAVFDPEAAMAPGAVQIHPHAPGNVAVDVSAIPPLKAMFESGDLEQGFAEADFIFEGTYETQRVHTCYMEPRICVVEMDGEDNVTIHVATQHVFGTREKLAVALGIGESKVKVIKSPYIGGGFGGKLELSAMEPVAALLSRKAGGRPVRIEHSRAEDFITTTRNPIKVHLKTGVKKDGTFTARYASSVLDCGAHATHGSEVILVHGAFGVFFNYHAPHQKWEGKTVYTNNMIGGGYRGYGAPQGSFAVESQIDEICTALKLDPIEMRLKNARQQGEPHPFNPAFTLSTYGLEDCLRQGAARIDWKARKAAVKGDGHRKRGVGVAVHPVWVSGCMGFPDIYEHSGAIVKLNRDGTADLATAAMDIGSGQIVTLCQIAAEELGLPAGAVRMSNRLDSDTVPFDAPTHASRVTYSAGNAVRAAAGQAKKRLLEVASVMLEVAVDDLEVRNGEVQVKGVPGKAIAVAAVAARAESPFIQMTPNGPQPTTIAEKGTIIGVASQAPPSNPTPCAAQFVEVEVDTETGEVTVLQAVYAHDIGRVINPRAAEGQVEGGFQQGMGYALMEQIQFDDSGACLTSDFLNYKMPTAVEMPRRMESLFIETDDPTGPFGAKSLGECCVITPAPAIANAIADAIGVRFNQLPITPEKILAGLGKL